jgi:hypothetical protein
VSGAAAFTAIAIVQLTRRWWLGIVGLAPGGRAIAWRNALRADAFQVFLVGLLLVLLIAWAERERRGSRRRPLARSRPRRRSRWRSPTTAHGRAGAGRRGLRAARPATHPVAALEDRAGVRGHSSPC